jgi:hypothetical protein
MNAFTPLLFICALAFWSSGCVSDLSAERTGEVDSSPKAFVQYGLDRCSEAYLICVYEAQPTRGCKNEVEIQATVVDRIKGKKHVGERFAFRRGSDSGPFDSARLRGELFYVFLGEDADGRLYVDAQDPQALWKYSAELHRIVEKYRRKG